MSDPKFPEPPLSPEERRRRYAEDAERELQEDILLGQMAEISAKLEEAWTRGDKKLEAELIAERSRLMDLKRSL